MRFSSRRPNHGINILAVCAWGEGSQAVIRLVPDDTVRVMDALRARRHETRGTATALVIFATANNDRAMVALNA